MRFLILSALLLVDSIVCATAQSSGTVGYNRTTLSVAPTNLIFRAASITSKITNASIYGITGILKGDGIGGSVLATPGVDYEPAGGGGTTVFVNGSEVSTPNFTNSATATFSVSTTNVSVNPTNLANAQIAAGAAIDFSKLSGVAASVHVHAGEDITSGTVAAARIDSAIATDAEVAAGFQPLDSDLTALAGNGSNGLLARTGSGTVEARTITGDSEITVSNGDGVSGNPTLAIASSIARDSEVSSAVANVIHSNVAGEITAITDKATPVAADHILIEDSAASDAKKDITIASLETALEGFLDLQDLQGAVTDAQVPNTITVDLATLATTATIANSGDSATAFFSSGEIEDARLPSTLTRDSEWDTIGEIETATSVNIIVATEVDSQTELESLTGVSFATDSEISEATLEALLDLPDLQGQISDAQIADGAIDGGTGGEIADGSITEADLNSSLLIWTNNSGTVSLVTASNLVQLGTGTQTYFHNANTGQLLVVVKGEAADGDTNANPLVKVSRYIDLEKTGVGDGAELGAALVSISATEDTENNNAIQTVGVFASAYSVSTNTVDIGGRDAVGIYAQGASYGGGVGRGGFIGSETFGTTNKANSLELAVNNSSGADGTYNSTGFSSTSLLWMNGTGTHDSAVGLSFGNAFGRQFEVGIGFTAQSTDGKVGFVKNSTIRDDGNAAISIDINGTRTDGVNTEGATLSGLPLKVASGQKAGQFDHLAPTTTRGDLIARGASANERLALGAVGTVLASDGVDLSWREPQNTAWIYDEHLTPAGGSFGWASSVSGAGAAFNGTAGIAGRPGIFQFITGTTSNAITGLRTTAIGVLFGGGAMRFRTSIRIPTLSVEASEVFTVSIGFYDAGSAVGNGVDGAYFIYSSSGTYYANVGNWSGITANNSTRTEVSSGIAVVAGTWYKLEIAVNAAGTAVEFFVNDVSIGTSATNIPTATGRETAISYKVEKQLGITSRALDADYTGLLNVPTAAR